MTSPLLLVLLVAAVWNFYSLLVVRGGSLLALWCQCSEVIKCCVP